MNSLSEENYLKAIYILNHDEGSSASTNQIADKMNTKASSVTVMLKKLKEKELVNYQKYQSTKLTDKGKKVAISVIRKHRLWEHFLVNKLDFNWDQVHDIAEQLEHIRSEELTNRLEALLDYPSFDPHGDPIPDKNGVIPKRVESNLSHCKEDKEVEIVGVTDHSTDFYNYLQDKDINLGSKVKIESINPFDSSLEININDHKKAFISKEVAENLLVKHLDS